MSGSMVPSDRFSLLERMLKIQCSKRSPEQGLTIMECLVAIALIGLTVAMVTPPLLIATATRVQNRRAEQAVQIAQDEVDRINTLVQQGQHQNNRLPATTAAPLKNTSVPTQLANFLRTSRRSDSACPAGSAFASATRYTSQILQVGQALPIDVDGDCNPDFMMQVFRTAGSTTQAEINTKPDATTRRPARFDLGVRVYSWQARPNLGSAVMKADPAPLSITNTRGQQDRAPLAVVYKPITWGEKSDVLCESLSAASKAKLIETGACPSPTP